MEQVEADIVIVGAGIAGLSTSLGLHRLGLRSLILESSDSLRTTGFALTLWTNAWRALDALGVADHLRQSSLRFVGFQFSSLDSGTPAAELSYEQKKYEKCETRCIKRKELLKTLLNELPQGTIRYSSKVVSIEDSGHFKLLHLADGCVIRTKVLIGSDGVNSIVAKSLGLSKPISVGRSAIRGYVEYPGPHNLIPKVYFHFGGGVRFGFAPCDEKSIYWFCTLNPSTPNWHEDNAGNPVKLKEFVLSKITNVRKEVMEIVERTELHSISCAELKLRLPWDLLIRHISERNVCVAGDALHPMTPDLGQGGCSALEDGVILARCIGESFGKIAKGEIRKGKADADEEEMLAIYKGLEEFANCRKWRSFRLIATGRLIGFIQESDHKLMHFLREKFLSKFTIDTLMRVSDFDCGKL